jgi:choice-of-anchor B domain-containing protein
MFFAASPGATGQEAACVDGFAASYPCASVNLLSRVTLGEMNGSYANDIWGWTDDQTGKEYALVGLSDGTSFVDVSNPTEPVFIGKLPGRGSPSTWRDVKVYADHAFVVSEASGHGMQVFDLTQLRDRTGPTTFSETTHYNTVGRVHNIAINEDTGYAYIVGAGGGAGCSGGLHMVDIQDPLNPTFAGCFDDDGYTHDVQCVIYSGPDTDYTDAEVCFASNEDTVTIVDVTDKSNPIEISQAVYPNDAYTHQGWLTEDHKYFIANDEIDEQTFGFNTRTLIFDVEDLDSPEFARAYLHPTASTDHNSYVKGRFAYQSNYTSGLRIVDLDRLLSTGGPVREIAFFDTFTQNDNVGFGGGSWSNYPFFDSGIVIVSDQDNGLFVVDPLLPGENPVASEQDATPGSVALSAAYPNPFADRTQFELTLGDAQEVDVAVYDVLGRRVVDLFRGTLGANEQRSFMFDGTALPAGLYFIRVTGEDFAETRQVALTR